MHIFLLVIFCGHDWAVQTTTLHFWFPFWLTKLAKWGISVNRKWSVLSYELVVFCQIWRAWSCGSYGINIRGQFSSTYGNNPVPDFSGWFWFNLNLDSNLEASCSLPVIADRGKVWSFSPGLLGKFQCLLSILLVTRHRWMWLSLYIGIYAVYERQNPEGGGGHLISLVTWPM